MSYKCTVPVAQSETNQCFITPKWFVDGSEYNALVGSFKLLINGEEAFGEVYRAIEAAQRSVKIICWGFQPSMRFIRDGNSMSIGDLLEAKAIKGVQVKVLCYTLDPAIPWTPFPVADVVGFSGEANTPGRRGVNINNRPATHTSDQYTDDRRWYGRYNEDSWLNKNEDRAIKYVDGVRDMEPRTKNLRFLGRGFSSGERTDIATKDYDDKGLSVSTKAILTAVPTHHQKMVVIDHGDEDNCVGFLMGHNMLDEYWDTNAHSCHRKAAHQGRNGSRPRHDFSCRLNGPLVGDLFRNFTQAWEKETKEKVAAPDFSRYPFKKDDGTLPIGGQLLRTQPQYGVEDIKKLYLQAVGNATQYIHVENQYFRWPPLAEKIKECAIGQTTAGRQPELDGPLYLFVITNADSEGMGPGVHNTYRMLESLGRADVLPEVTRQERPDDLSARLGQVRQEIALARKKKTPSAAEQANLNALRAKEKDLSDQRKAAQENQASKNPQPIKPDEVDGLKVLVCTLVSPDSPGRTGSTTVDASGRALTKEERVDALNKSIKEIDQRQAALTRQSNSLETEMQEGVARPASYFTERQAGIDQDMAQNAALRQTLSQELRDVRDAPEPDNNEHQQHLVDWVDVYIHAKLMMIDDAFMTLGSANINTRSMQVDSELNLALDRPDVTATARRALWNRHTGGQSGNEAFNRTGMEKEYKNWQYVMERNKKQRAQRLSPIAPLVEFYSGTTSRTDND